MLVVHVGAVDVEIAVGNRRSAARVVGERNADGVRSGVEVWG